MARRALPRRPGTQRHHARRTPARRAARRVRARRGRPPVAARHPRRRALRLRRRGSPAARSGSGSASARSAAGTTSTSTGCTRCSDAVERTRHIPRLAAARLPDEHRALVASTPATTPGSTARRPRSPAPRSWSTRPSTARWRTACAGADDLDLRVRARGPRRARRRVLAGPRRWPGRRPTARDEMTRYSPGRSALLWNAHNAAFGLLAPARRAGAAAPVRGVPRRPARPRCASSPRSPGSTVSTDGPGVPRRRRHADLRRRAQRRRQPDALHASAGRRCAATTPGAARCPPASAGWSARSARRCCGAYGYPLRAAAS